MKNKNCYLSVTGKFDIKKAKTKRHFRSPLANIHSFYRKCLALEVIRVCVQQGKSKRENQF